ncbi:MAG: hypothetical protein ACOZNI_34050 [Myxococcota bacterium]
MRPVALLPLIALACTPDQGLTFKKDDPLEIDDGSIKGRVCDPSGRTWLPDAMAYVNIVGDDGQIFETKIAYSDLDGYWEIADLPGENEYTVYVQYGPDLLQTETVWVGSGEDVELEEPDCFDPLALDVAVVTGDYDDFNLVLNEMGFANYQLIDGLDETVIKDFLSDPAELARYDIIFFNGGFIEDGVIYDLEDATNAETAARVENIRAYVEAGGSIYASDWAYDVVELGWADNVNFVGADELPNDAQMGDYEVVNAAISDAALAEYLGTDRVEIDYDLPVWPPVETVADNVSVHLTGTVPYSDGLSDYYLTSVPLLLSFNAGQGKVVFSTFRVARNASQEMVDTLQYMMYNL